MAINYNDEKIGKFYQAILHYGEEQRKKIEEEVAAFKQKELDEAEIGVLTEAYHLIQKEMAQMRSGIARELAQREMDGRRALLEQRRKIMEQVFSRAAEELRAYTQKPEYAALLQTYARNLSSAFQKEGTVILLRKEDAPYQQQIAEAFGQPCRLQQRDGDHGGRNVGRHAGGSARLVRRKLWIDAGRITVAATRRKGMIQT